MADKTERDERKEERAENKAEREAARAKRKADREAAGLPPEPEEGEQPEIDNTLPGDLPPKPTQLPA